MTLAPAPQVHDLTEQAHDLADQAHELDGHRPTAHRSEVESLVERAVLALHDYARLTQDDVDHIVAKAAVAALDQHGQLAQAAVAETGRGLFEDKAVKNIFACEHVTHSMKGLRTVGVISRDELTGITEIAEPVGVIAGVTPVTNPTSTTIFKSLLALKTRNPIVFGFHPAAQRCSAQAAGSSGTPRWRPERRSTASSGSSTPPSGPPAS